MSTTGQSNFVVNEPIPWRWSAEGNHDTVPAPRRHLLTWPQLALALALSATMVWRDYATDYCVENRCRGALLFAVLLAVTILIALTKASGLGNRDLDRNVMSFFRSSNFSEFRARVLTPTRLMRLHWDGSIDSFPLSGGDVVIQYGQLRMDRPDRRGRALIRNIPKTVQADMFAAIGCARAMRKDRSELSA